MASEDFDLPEGWRMFVLATKEALDRGTDIDRVENVPSGLHVICKDGSTFTVARRKDGSTFVN